MKDRQKLISHALMVMAPLVMLIALTAAWFVQSQSVGVTPMSFASQSTGPGAVIYPGALVANTRVYDKTHLAAKVRWGAATAQENSDITIKNMVPGQCEFYLLVSDNLTDVFIRQTLLKDSTGKEVETGASLPLAQCIGVYLVPVELPAGTTIPGSISDLTTDKKLALTRGTTGQLNAAIFKDIKPASGTAIASTTGTKSKAYVLALFCDPVYQQEAGFAPVNILEGSIGFSLSFTG
ncbi:MAG: hypothetical protein RR281_01440 [Pseudoflavonifractor sp.]